MITIDTHKIPSSKESAAMGSGELKNLIDIPKLQALMDSFYKASSIPVGILDTAGNILVATGWQDICTKFHRVHPETSAKCKISDDYIKSNLRVGEYIEYRCQNNLWDLATPIVIRGKHVATLFTGQFFYDDEKVDTEFFRRQAAKYGFPADRYLEALSKVPVFTRERVKHIMDYYTQFVQMLINMGLARMELEEYQENLRLMVDERTQKVLETTDSLRESEEKYRQFFHASNAVKLLINPETGKIIDANDAACRFYGYPRDVMATKYIYEINTLTPAEINVEMEAAKTEKRNYFNFRHRLSSGEIRDVESYSSPGTIGGKTVLYSIVHDITERKKSENLLRCRAELSALFATASVDELIQSGLDAAERLTASRIGYFHFVNDDQENLTLQTWSTNTIKNMCKAEGKGAHYPISTAGVWVDCFYRKKPVIHNDYASLPHKKGMPEGHAPVIRELSIPVIQRGKVVAIMGVGNKGTDYTQEDVEIAMESASILFDLVERKRAEEAVRASQKRLAEAQRMAKVGDWTWNILNNALTWSDELYDIFGLNKATYVPTLEKYADLVHPADRHIMLEENYMANIGKKNHAIEYRIIAQDTGEVKHLLAKGETEFSEDGKPLFVRGTLQDITERKEAEREKEQLVAELSRKATEKDAILASQNNVILSYDLKMNVQQVNPAFSKIYGFDPVGLNVKEIIRRVNCRNADGSPLRLEEQPTPKAIRGEVTDSRLYLVTKADGASGFVDTSSRPLLVGDKVAGSVTVWHDVTDLKMKEKELRVAKEAAEAATTLKDKFVSLVAHDLKSPLSAMTGFLKLVRDDEAKPLDEGAKLILDRAIDSGKQLSTLIDELLNMNRLKTGQLKLDRQFFDAKYLGAKMCVDYAYSAENKGIKLINRIPDNSRIFGDRTLLGEALQNLITNAIKFCRKGDSVTISLSDESKTSIQVKDTGPGMKPEFIKRIFKYETKVSTVGTAGEHGTGFGLPLARDILLLHGGDLEAACELGMGCVFTLKIPYVRPRILIVDDDPTFRFLLAEYLKKLDADITQAEDGVSAADIIAKGKELPHLIISDIEMPKMTGLELLSYLQKRHKTQSIPVIIISGKHGMEIRDTVYGLGGKDFLTKELDVDDFIPRVRRFIS